MKTALYKAGIVIILLGPLWWILSVGSFVILIFTDISILRFYFANVGSTIVTILLIILDVLSIIFWLKQKPWRFQ